MIESIAKVNIDKFVFALRAYKAATQKAMPDILNRAARNVAFRASSFTPVANPSKIRSSLMGDPNLRYALTALALKKRGVGVLKHPEFANAVEAFVSRRMASSRYLRAAYAEAVQQLGGSFRGTKFRGAKGFANKASIGRLLVQIVAITSQPNQRSAHGAEAIGIAAINKAVAYVADDMLSYAKQELAFKG